MQKPYRASHVEIIEDHTHDPYSKWAYNSRSDWCIASLRKTLPIPDGGVLWSPVRNSLPIQAVVTRTRSEASLKKLVGMYLKAAYLVGARTQKEDFRALLTTGEEQIAAGEISGILPWSASLVDRFPIEIWRESRTKNHNVLCDRLQNVRWLHIRNKDDEIDRCPFSAVMPSLTPSYTEMQCAPNSFKTGSTLRYSGPLTGLLCRE